MIVITFETLLIFVVDVLFSMCIDDRLIGFIYKTCKYYQLNTKETRF